MSMGPTTKENFKTGIGEKTRLFAKSVSRKYWENPFYYLFHLMLAATVSALFFNKLLPGAWYLFLVCALAGEIITEIYRKK